MSQEALFAQHPFLLLEASVIERIRRSTPEMLHPSLQASPMVYDPRGRSILCSVYDEYIAIACNASVPITLSTPTWRVDRTRVEKCKVPFSINEDVVAFMKSIRVAHSSQSDCSIYINGLMGVCNDCYKPEESLDTTEAEEFHAWQAERLAGSGVDFLLAATIPSAREALGMARAFARTNLPCVISFVLGRDGNILDGTAPEKAIGVIDDDLQSRAPTGYMFNCCYPTFLNTKNFDQALLTRLIGFQANGSSTDPRDLDQSETLQEEPVEQWAKDLVRFHKQTSAPVLGGCCGTDCRHLIAMINHLQQ